jgi:thiol-disulfide isomerase/thioredoxin
VKLIVATPDQTAYLRNGTDLNDQGNVQAETDAQGHYALPPVTGIYTIVATHKNGYAELPKASAEKSGDISLTAWARIEGDITIAGKPGANSEISANRRDERYEENAPRIYHQVETKADANGHFVIERVQPGKLGVVRSIRIPMSAQSWMNSPTHSTVVEAKPGETAHVKLGGTGRPVVGRVAIPPELASRKDWRFTEARLMTSRPKPPEISADDKAKFKTMTPEQRKAWQKDWMKSKEYVAWSEANQKANDTMVMCALVIQPDGSFRGDDVPGGDYDVMIQASKPDPNGSCGPGDALAVANTKITVAPVPGGGRSDDPAEAGTIEMKVNKTVSIGDVAPAFSVKTLDGKDLKLADFKGKYVVLDFWATWCGPCVAETPHLKALYDAYSANPNFAMISLSLDEKVDEPKAFVEKEKTAWHQGFLGEWSNATLPNEYGVHGIPSIWLIGPDGKVLAKDLRGPQMKDRVGQLMSASPAAAATGG